jgi:transposase
MVNHERRIYPEAFKMEALELLKRGDKHCSALERDLGISRGLLSKWRDRYKVNEKEGMPGRIEPSDLEAAKAEIRRLQRELANVEEEREILKKVLSIFSRPGRRGTSSW